MKKIAIISELTLNNVNYGNRLQAYALNFYLNKNYKNYTTESLQSDKINIKKRTKITFKTFLNFSKHLIKKRKNLYDFSNRLKLFNQFTENNIIINKKVNKENLKQTNYDMFIVGSDVVWAQANGVVNVTKFLNFKAQKQFKKVSYAASFGRDYIPKENKKYLSKVLKQFDFISLREKSSIKLLNDISINNVFHTCDPTLLLSKEHWNTISKKIEIKDKYIFVYLLGKDINQRNKIKQVADKLNLKIVTIPHANGVYNKVDNDFGDYILDNCSPEEWIYLISNAEYIFTDSFHGIIFSTIFEKKFIALKREYTEDINNRLIDYLDTIEEKDKYMLVPSLDKLKKMNWNYKKINTKLDNFIDKSKKYLDEIFNK